MARVNGLRSAVAAVAVVAVGCVVSAAPAARGDAQPRDCTVTGTGVDRDAAILNGLVQAVEQIDGVNIDQKSTVYRRYVDTVADMKSDFRGNVTNDDQTRTATHGLIDHFAVTGESPEPRGGVRVQLTVRVFAFDPNAALQMGRRRVIAVAPFRSARATFPVLGHPVGSDDEARRLSQALVDRIAQSRKFTILDRDFAKELGDEQQLIKAGDMPPAEQVRLGQQLGADFLLVGQIEDLTVSSDTFFPKGAFAPVDRLSGYVAVSYRILNVATGKVHWASTVRWSADDGDLRPPADHAARADDLLLDHVADGVSDDVVDRIYPLRILDAVTPTQFMVNRGGNRMRVGAVYDVFQLGTAKVDPDTGETLDPIETQVATVRLTRVADRQSYVDLISGDPTRIVLGQSICRKVELTKVPNDPNIPPGR